MASLDLTIFQLFNLPENFLKENSFTETIEDSEVALRSKINRTLIKLKQCILRVHYLEQLFEDCPHGPPQERNFLQLESRAKGNQTRVE